MSTTFQMLGFLYLLGCVSVVLLTIVKLILNQVLIWLFGDRILSNNLKKVNLDPQKSLGQKIVKYLVLFIFDVLLSWVNVLIIVWQISGALIGRIRNLLSPKPEAVKQLLFPLRINPNLSKETVWARIIAMGPLVNGRQPTAGEIITSLSAVADAHPPFDKATALQELEELRIVKTDLIADVSKTVQLIQRR